MFKFLIILLIILIILSFLESIFVIRDELTIISFIKNYNSVQFVKNFI